MKITIEQSNRIDDYLQEKLTEKEKEDFEREVTENEALRKEIQFRKEIKYAFEITDVEKVMEDLEEPPKRLPLKRWMAIAASVLLLIAAYLFYPKTLALPEIANKYELKYTPPNLILVAVPGFEDMSTNEQPKKIRALLEQAQQAFERRDYREVRRIFDELRFDMNYRTREMMLYEGIMHYETADYDKAAQQFTEIIEESYQDVPEDAHWYLGLTYLKMDKTDEAKKQFDILVEIDSKAHKDHSLSILKQIKNL